MTTVPVIAAEGRKSVAVAVAATAASALLSPLLGLVGAGVTALFLWFYRDPERKPPQGETLWVSPADGKVVEVLEASHPYVGRTVKIGIFMSPLDVHVNRTPATGTVDYLEYVPGKKLMAFNEKASEENERFLVGLETDQGRLLLVQIAGFLARRIASPVRRGDSLERGRRYGMIKLGSKVDVYLPPTLDPSVVVGQRVKAGETVIGVVKK